MSKWEDIEEKCVELLSKKPDNNVILNYYQSLNDDDLMKHFYIFAIQISAFNKVKNGDDIQDILDNEYKQKDDVIKELKLIAKRSHVLLDILKIYAKNHRPNINNNYKMYLDTILISYKEYVDKKNE